MLLLCEIANNNYEWHEGHVLPNLHKNQTIPPLEETAVSKALTPIKNDEDDDNLSSPQVKDKEISFLCQGLVDDPKFPELTETVPPVSKALLDPPSPASLATDASLNSPNKKSIRGITYGMFDDRVVLGMQMNPQYKDEAAERIKMSLVHPNSIKMAQNVDSNFRARFLKNEPKDTWESLHERLSPTIEFFVGIKKTTCLLASQIALWDESNELTPISSCLKGLIASGSSLDSANPTAGEVPSTGQSSKMIRSIGPELAKRAKAEPKTENFELYHFHAERALLVLTAQRADNIARAYLDKIIDLYKGADRLEQAVKAKTFQHKYIVLFVYNRYPSCNICHHVFKSVIDDLERLIRTKFIGHCNTLYSAHKGIETIQPHLMILHKHMSQESSLLLNNETTEFYLPQSMAK